MDERELAHRAKVLPDRFADRAGDELLILRSLAGGGEWAELVDDLVATLVRAAAPVTAAERNELSTLANAMSLELTEPLDKLTVQG